MSLVFHADGRERQVKRGTWAPGVQGHCGDLTAKLEGAGGGGRQGSLVQRLMAFIHSPIAHLFARPTSLERPQRSRRERDRPGACSPP